MPNRLFTKRSLFTVTAFEKHKATIIAHPPRHSHQPNNSSSRSVPLSTRGPSETNPSQRDFAARSFFPCSASCCATSRACEIAARRGHFRGRRIADWDRAGLGKVLMGGDFCSFYSVLVTTRMTHLMDVFSGRTWAQEKAWFGRRERCITGHTTIFFWLAFSRGIYREMLSRRVGCGCNWEIMLGFSVILSGIGIYTWFWWLRMVVREEERSVENEKENRKEKWNRVSES